MKKSELKQYVNDLFNAQTPENQASVIHRLYKRIKSDKGYTPKDLCEFAEWCSDNGWVYIDGSDIWGNNVDRWEEKTTSQLREQWEIETGRRKP